MMSPNPAIPSHRSAIDYSLDAQLRADLGQYDDVRSDEKWPVWARMLVIIGLSALLWTGIISAVVALIG